MAPHRYAVGQTVEFVPNSMTHAAWRGAYVVVRRLDGPPQEREYRIRHLGDGHERVAPESHLRDPDPGPGRS